MLKAEQIPDKVVEALQCYLSGCDCDECIAGGIAAAINAWPGGIREPEDAPEGVVIPAMPFPYIILPLKQEGE